MLGRGLNPGDCLALEPSLSLEAHVQHARDPLPVLPIPLRESDPDARLDLQAALHHVYDAARYGNYIYEGTPQPALRAADENPPNTTEWIAPIRAQASIATTASGIIGI